MIEIVDFLRVHPFFASVAILLNTILAAMVITKLIAAINSIIQDAKAGRGEKQSNYKKYMELARKSIEDYERKNHKANHYKRAVEKTRQAGYHSEYAPVTYLIIMYVVPVIMFALGYAINFPNYKGALLMAVYIPVITEITLKSKKKSIAMEFQMSSYKIYKYLHNQISAGINVSEAIKSIYEVPEDKKLRLVLIKLAGAYGRTLDIDYALQEFETYFDIPEAQTLAVALKQGIDTGDNQGILEKQEEVMFGKFIDYIQAETDTCKNRSIMAVAFFVAIIVIMISVPMYNDMVEAVTKIFIN